MRDILLEQPLWLMDSGYVNIDERRCSDDRHDFDASRESSFESDGFWSEARPHPLKGQPVKVSASSRLVNIIQKRIEMHAHENC